MSDQPSHSRRVARSAVWNVAGQVVPAAVAFFLIPPTIRGLGTERFGLLTIAWVVLGYFGLFDAGLARATTRALARAVAAGGDDEIAAEVKSSLAAHAMVGVSSAALLAIVAPLLVSFLKVPPALAREVLLSLWVLAACVPFIALTSALRGVLEGLQRFDLVNLVKIASGSASFIVPPVVLLWTTRLDVVVAGIAAARLLALLALGILTRSIVRRPILTPRLTWQRMRMLFGFGGWVSLSQAVGMLVPALDRFAIGARLSASAVAAYATPYEILGRLYGVYGALSVVTFPSFSSFVAAGDVERLRSWSRLSTRGLLIITAPVLVLLAGADLLLNLWVGPELASAGSGAAQILLAGLVIGTAVQVPVAILHAFGKATTVAMISLSTFVLTIPLVWIAAGRGVEMVALIWTFRVAVNAVLILIAEGRLFDGETPENGRVLIVAAASAAGGLAIAHAPAPALMRIAAASALAAAVALFTWLVLLDASQRRSMLVLARDTFRRGAGR